MSSTKTLEADLGYKFENQNLLIQALSHCSVGTPNNQRLEYLGDSILGFMVAEYLYHKYPNLSEGDLTKMRARLVRKSTLANLARNLDLKNYLRMGVGELRSGSYNRDSILSDALEALVGAIYIDGGITSVKSVLDPLYKDLLETIKPTNLKDSKTLLQEALQKHNLPLPEYKVTDQTGAAHKLTFTVMCSVQGLTDDSSATGNSRKAAEQQVAAKVLDALQIMWPKSDQ